MMEWKYKVVTVNTRHEPTTLEWAQGDDCGSEWLEKWLDSIGADGWELVAFFPARPADQIWKHPVSKFESLLPANQWLYHAVFKRPPETLEERKERVEKERLERRRRTASNRS
jgi:DNA-binding PadR family transcriptional regulator